MAKQLRALLMDQDSPSPSVEAILHAIMPFKFVDHSHTDALVTLSNNPNGEAIIAELYPDCLILPYIMPGFILSKQVYDALKGTDITQYKGIILHHHGLFTFSDDAREAYENHLELVSRANTYIADKADHTIPPAGAAPNLSSGVRPDLIELAKIRKAVSNARGCAQLANLNSTPAARAYASRHDIAQIATRGPITPDHVIRTKRTAAILEFQDNTLSGVDEFVTDYQEYFHHNGNDSLTMLDPAPRFAIWKKHGVLSFGSTMKECDIINDIARHTAWSVQTGESLGGWQALPEQDIFDLEYWILEQAKLKKSKGTPKPHLGKVAIVTGACGGIGRATAEQLHADGAVVIGLDINPQIEENLNQPGLIGRVCDLTDEDAIQQAIEEVIFQFGGLDIVVLNAGIFKSGETIDVLDETWDRSIAINLTASQRFLKHTIPYLKHGVDASIIVIGSRNYHAPGAGAAAYSVSKAGITQLARVAALELCKHQVRVNILHPDAVFDTDLWTPEALARSAKRYNMTIEQYKSKNLLGREVKSTDVARLASTVASDVFCATTGAQVPIDGGSERVI